MNSLAFINNLFQGPGLLILLAVALLFGAKRLPELGRSIGETVRELKKSNKDREEEEAARLKTEEKK